MVKELDLIPDFTPGELTFAPIPKYQHQRNIQDELKNGLKKEDCIQLLDVMLIVRAFEESIASMKSGAYKPLPDFKFVGATHLSIGQEGVAAGIMKNLHREDYITSTHRGHGHSIAKGMFGLYSMNEEELARFLEKDPKGTGRDAILDEAVDHHLYKTYCELFGRIDGYCKGRGGGMHIADFNMGHLGANAIVGGSFGIGTGAAIASERLKNGKITVCIVGDGGYCNGIALEAMNMAAMDQFKNGIPLIYIIENNQYMMTGQGSGEVTGVDHIARRGAGVSNNNMHAEIVNGMNVLAVIDALKRGIQKIKDGQGPVLLEMTTYRYLGHSLSDMRTTYRTKKEEEAWHAVDSIINWKKALVESGVMTESEIEEHEQKARELTETAAVRASKAAEPETKDIYEGLLSNTIEETVPADYSNAPSLRKPRKYKRDSEGYIMFRHAVAEAITEEMVRDSRVCLFGEDVADYGGAFQVTVGLLSTFGRNRVWNAAISESAIVGAACGMAMAGMRPIAEIMYIDFMLMAGDQWGNQLAKNKYMFGGKATIPAVIRTTVGGGKGYAGQHSQSLEASLTQVPGLKVVMPSTAYDVKGLLKASIRDNDPVIFIEHQTLYTEKGQVPEEDYVVPIGKAAVRREGTDLTLVSYSYLALRAAEAAERLEKEEGISVEVIDPRTLIPLDSDTIAESVKKTGRLAVTTQAPVTGSFAETIIYETQQKAFSAMKCPAEIIGARNVPPPMAQTLEQDNIPSVERIMDSIRKMVKS